MLCCARILVCTFGFEGKINLWGGCWGEPFQSVAHLEETPCQVRVPATNRGSATPWTCGLFLYSVQSLADWEDSWEVLTPYVSLVVI